MELTCDRCRQLGVVFSTSGNTYRKKSLPFVSLDRKANPTLITVVKAKADYEAEVKQ